MSFIDYVSPSRRKARRNIETMIRHGLLSLDEIASRAASEADDSLGEDILKEMVADAWRRTARSHPKRPTPLDRVQAAFDALDAAGVMARHYPVSGRSDAQALIADELAAAERAGRMYQGYCFYDEPLAELMWAGELAFCFGPAIPPATYADLWQQQAEVATKLAEALRKQGFEVQWTGRPADVVVIGGIQWAGPRDASGAPMLPIGRRLESAGPRPERARPAVKNVFVGCAAGTPEAHRLIAAIARQTGSRMFGSVEQSGASPAAVAVRMEDGALLDLVAGEAQPGPRGILRRRDLAVECRFLLVVAPSAAVADRTCPSWEMFPPAKRALVVDGISAPPAQDGSILYAVDFASGQGIPELLRAVGAAVV